MGLAALALAASYLLLSRESPEKSQTTEKSTEQSKTEAPDITKHAATTESAEVLLEARKEWTGDLQGMKERGFVRVLTVFNPLMLSYDGANQSGLVVDMVNVIEKELNKGSKGRARLNVIVIPVPRDRLLPDLIAGHGDVVMANLTVTAQRKERVDFAAPVFKDVKELLVTGQKYTDITNLEDLGKAAIAVRPSSSYFENLELLNKRRSKEGKNPLTVEPADEFLEDFDILDLVNSGATSATVVDSHKAKLWSQFFDKIVVHENIAISEAGTVAWAIRKNSPELLTFLDKMSEKLRQGSMIGNTLVKRYLGKSKKLEAAINQQLNDEHEKVFTIIQKYAGEYGFDWLLITAQGFQESRLDNKKRSKAGAVGVMQVLKSTAKDPNVAIPNVEKLEDNIHAAIKYSSFLSKRYFSDPEITPFDRVLFTLAAYNAGPGNISKARKAAARMNLDPNQWIGHTEVAAAKTISREPVIYVRNILKYFVSYSNSDMMRKFREEHVKAKPSNE
ncbi:MAG: transglycosylase SLT domain-containing protein [Hyphomicrobiales bacterium]